MSKASNCKQKQFTNFKNEMDKYEVIKLLGEGSFGRVYKAKVVSDSSFVALKVISKGRRSDKEIKGLRQECEIQRYLHHPNIIQMLDSFETPGEIVVVTEFAHKELNSILGKEGYLSEDRAFPIILDLVSALNYLHTHRVLHRDLKPQNILIDLKNRAKLCDFGFARSMSTGTHVLTSIKGTPLYMAPELIQEKPYDHKADLWSLGCIMYEILVGAPPFSTASILHLIRLIRHEQIQWPTFVSENCISFLKGLLQKDPADRINWQEILNHPFVKGHILICDDSTSLPLTRPFSTNTTHSKEQQRQDHMSNKSSRAERKKSANTPETKKSHSQDSKNSNLKSKEDDNKSTSRTISQQTVGSTEKYICIEESHPIETEEWIVFLQKSMEDVISGEMMSLTQTNLIVSPLRNTNINPKVLTYVSKLLSLPFVIRGENSHVQQTKRVYLEVKLVPNLVNATKLLLRIKSGDSLPASPALPSPHPPTPEHFKTLADCTDEDFDCLECVFVLITHLLHLDNEFLSQFCDAIVVLNVYHVLRFFLSISKNRLQLVTDVLAVLTHILRVFPEYTEIIEKTLEGNEERINFVELLRHNNALLKERACFFLLFLGKHSNKMETLWNESVRETLEALMYDSIESVRSAADRTVEELKSKEFYKA